MKHFYENSSKSGFVFFEQTSESVVFVNFDGKETSPVHLGTYKNEPQEKT